MKQDQDCLITTNGHLMDEINALKTRYEEHIDELELEIVYTKSNRKSVLSTRDDDVSKLHLIIAIIV